MESLDSNEIENGSTLKTAPEIVEEQLFKSQKINHNKIREYKFKPHLNAYIPSVKTYIENKLEPGIYNCFYVDDEIAFVKKDIAFQKDLIVFPNSINDKVINEFEIFWNKRNEYKQHGEPHKRGFLLWGPPGSGKTCTISLIADKFIKNDGVVFNFSVEFKRWGIEQFRRIEPNRKILILLDDIDKLCDDNAVESHIMEFLDGTIQHVNTIVIATTNYPERIPDRLINRPSRFDRVEYIGMPSEVDRKLYIKKKSTIEKNGDLSKWVKDTDGFSIAHIKELITAVEVFDLDYSETIERMNAMRQKKYSSKDYEKILRGKSRLGFE